MNRKQQTCNVKRVVAATPRREDDPGRTIGAAFEELRKLCRAEGYRFPTVTRVDRAGPFE